MSKIVFLGTILILTFLACSSGESSNPKEFVNEIENEMKGIRAGLDNTGNELEDILDDCITPLVDRFNAFFNYIDYLCGNNPQSAK